MMNRMIIYIFGMLCFISLISGIGSAVWSARMLQRRPSLSIAFDIRLLLTSACTSVC